MIIQSINYQLKEDFESILEKCIEEAEIFFKNKGMLYQIAIKNNEQPVFFRDALKEYISLKFGDKSKEAIKKIPRIIIKYDAFFNEGRNSYLQYYDSSNDKINIK
ncbi:MAG: hypothetical protein KatS3mg002_1437 [Candidatus Woesearchaeota archaeon]|nr:MAG: hypothetical protein KatS3mg002_1437 [Candidatus Woesearchaeota archaeon]